MHLLCLVYSNSSYYCKPVRIITLMREICNLIIVRTVKHLDSSSIFQIEPEEASDKVSECFKTLRTFKSCYKKYKKLLPSCFKERGTQSWEFRVSFNNFWDFLSINQNITTRMVWSLKDMTSSSKGSKFWMNFVQQLIRFSSCRKWKLVASEAKFCQMKWGK